MAQNPVNLQEPSMDELLASIREIIEESSAVTEANEFQPADMADGQSDVAQEESLGTATIPIQDAMKALAARIGLKKQAGARGATAKEPTPFPPSSPTVSVMPPAVASLSAAAPDLPTTSSALKPFPIKPARAAAPRPQPSTPLSVSIHTNTASSQSEKTQDIKIPPKPQATTTNKEVLPNGHIPLYPQFRAMPTSPESSLKSPSQTASTQDPSSMAKTMQSSPSPQQQENKQASSDLEKGFLAEFEQSAELLLRPYIASWLEEHFHHLFEKILREEIQRVMQKNLRR